MLVKHAKRRKAEWADGNGKRGKWEIQPLKIIYVSYIDHSFWLLTPRHSAGGWRESEGAPATIY